jgi:hypothetical protein
VKAWGPDVALVSGVTVDSWLGGEVWLTRETVDRVKYCEVTDGDEASPFH